MSPIAMSPAIYYHCELIVMVTSGASALAALAAPVLILTSFAAELATPTVTDVQTYVRTPYRV